ncbi:acyl carrier protein [Microbispora sp. NPDC088329]|uniref:acyl carrier protein n=1 Tax=unclassified Microbispora TaxID=2614687 RepID=UPI0034359EC4
MDRHKIVYHIKNALEQVLGHSVGEVAEETRLFDELALDSTSVIELLIVLEDLADVEIQADELEHDVFETVGSLADFLMKTEKVG